MRFVAVGATLTVPGATVSSLHRYHTVWGIASVAMSVRTSSYFLHTAIPKPHSTRPFGIGSRFRRATEKEVRGSLVCFLYTTYRTCASQRTETMRYIAVGATSTVLWCGYLKPTLESHSVRHRPGGYFGAEATHTSYTRSRLSPKRITRLQ